MKRMRIGLNFSTRAIAAFAALAISAIQIAPAMAQKSGAQFPATPVGKLAEQLVQVVNTGDKAVQSNFIKSSLSLKEESPEEYLGLMQKLYEQSGGFDVVEMLPANEAFNMRFNLRTKRGNRFLRMATNLSKDDPAKLDGFAFRPIANPESEKAAAWPETKISEADLVKEIERHAQLAASEDRFSGVVLAAKGDR